MASSSRISQTVVRLMGLFNSSRGASGEVGGGLAAQGVAGAGDHVAGDGGDDGPVKGGKGGLAASPGGVFEGKVALGPALPPAADAVGVEVEPGGEIDVGERRVLVQEQDQFAPVAAGATPPCEPRPAFGPRRGTHRGSSGDSAARGRACDCSPE